MTLICFGTRPEWLKIKPLLNYLTDYKLLFTGQHEDLLEPVEFDYRIDINGSENRLDAIISSCLLQFPDATCDNVLVQGDTASAFACALAAFHRKIEVIYLESGLRSHDLKHPYPEEGYRQMICRLASIHLCPTELSKANLEKENVSGGFYVVGNTSLDNIVDHKDKITYGNRVLITLHRRENHEIIRDWFQEIDRLAEDNEDLEFILPIHPNPSVIKHGDCLRHVKVIGPQNHKNLINILQSCKLVITDSGGIQEEATFLNKKTIVCRKITERPEGISTGHLHLCRSPQGLRKIFTELLKDPIINSRCPYGDGESSKKIFDILR